MTIHATPLTLVMSVQIPEQKMLSVVCILILITECLNPNLKKMTYSNGSHNTSLFLYGVYSQQSK